MDSTEYKILKTNYSNEDIIKIKEYNKSHTDMAKKILKYNRDKIINDKNYAELEISLRIKEIQNKDEFKDFCKTYPIVSKYIVAFGLFSSKAFNKYLNWKSTVRPSDTYRTELIKNPRKQELWKNKYIYAVYVKYLFQEKNPHCNLKDINAMYNEALNSLNEETNTFFNLYEQELNKIEDTKKEYNEERKNNIKNQLKIKLQHN